MDTLAPWITESFPVIRMVLMILIAIACLGMVISILASPANTGAGTNAITGASESYYTKNKGKNNQGRIRNAIILCAVIIAVSAILFFISYVVYPAPPAA